jgi:osmotically-inducible protein OsmY
VTKVKAMRAAAGWPPLAGLAGAILMAMPSSAPAQNRATTETLREQNLSAQSAAKHHYNSPAERAQDALLIVKVKSAIADSGIADNYPLTVDADHGRVTLTGVLASRDDVQRALQIVSGIEGVKSVNNRLTWVKQPG